MSDGEVSPRLDLSLFNLREGFTTLPWRDRGVHGGPGDPVRRSIHDRRGPRREPQSLRLAGWGSTTTPVSTLEET